MRRAAQERKILPPYALENSIFLLSTTYFPNQNAPKLFEFTYYYFNYMIYTISYGLNLETAVERYKLTLAREADGSLREVEGIMNPNDFFAPRARIIDAILGSNHVVSDVLESV